MSRNLADLRGRGQWRAPRQGSPDTRIFRSFSKICPWRVAKNRQCAAKGTEKHGKAIRKSDQRTGESRRAHHPGDAVRAELHIVLVSDLQEGAFDRLRRGRSENS